MKKWKVLDSEKVFESPFIQVIKEKTEDFLGKERDVYVLDPGYGSVMIIPVKLNPDTGAPANFVMIEQYRHPVGHAVLEFPAGRRERGESSNDAAVRELKEETGFDPKWMKFMYSLFVDTARSGGQMAVFLAVVEGEPEEQDLDDYEQGTELKVKEFTADELHKLVLDNELVSGPSLAALLSVVMQGKEFTKYLENLG